MEVCLEGEQEMAFAGREMGGGLVKMSLDKSCVLGQGILLCWSVLTSMETDLLRCFLDNLVYESPHKGHEVILLQSSEPQTTFNARNHDLLL